MKVLEVIIGLFGLAFVGVLLDDMLFGEKRAKARREQMEREVLIGGKK